MSRLTELQAVTYIAHTSVFEARQCLEAPAESARNVLAVSSLKKDRDLAAGAMRGQ